MPLVRLELRNEFGLGNPELYGGATRREDPKAVLDGVAVSGLVGILRQLGDLAGFAAEVFHDLHEQIAAASGRAYRMSSRIQHIELSLPSIEEAIQSQTSNIHFAYLPGSDWHANFQLEHDHLLSSDLPQFIMDSYEECRDPPRLFLLDKFDRAGAGSCLKRYSDPTYFKRVWATAQMVDADRVVKEKNAQNQKIQGSQMWNAELRHIVSLARHNNSIQFTTSSTDDQSIAAETVSASDIRLKSELESCSTSLDSRAMLSCVGPHPSLHSSIDLGESVDTDTIQLNDGDCTSAVSDNAADSNSISDTLQEQNVPHSQARWAEITKNPINITSYVSNTILVERLLDVEARSLKDGGCEHGGKDAGFKKLDEHMFFEVGNTCPQGVALFEEDNLDADFEMLNGVFSGKESVSLQLPSVVAENSLINYGNSSCQGEFLSEPEERQTKDEGPPKYIPGDVQCELHQGSMPFKQQDMNIRFGSSLEHLIDLANTSRQDTILSDSREDRSFPPYQNHFDEIICETENYVDALNIVDFDTDKESEDQNAQEQQTSSICNHSVDTSSQDAGETLPSHSDYSIGDTFLLPQAIQNTVNYSCISSPSISPPESLLANSPSPKKQFAPDCDLYMSFEGSKNNMCTDQLSSLSISNSETILENGNVIDAPSLSKFQGNCEARVEPSIKIWTNACLFGVEPSKPPDFSMPGNIDQNSVLGMAILGQPLTAGLVSTDSPLDDAFTTSNCILHQDDNVTKNPCYIEKDNVSHGFSTLSHTGSSPYDMHAGGKLDDVKQPSDSVGSSSFYENREAMFENPLLSGCSKSAGVDSSELQFGDFCSKVQNLRDSSAASFGDKLPMISLEVQDSDSRRKPISRSAFFEGVVGTTTQRDPLQDAENSPSSSKKLQEGCLPVQQRIWSAKVKHRANCETLSTEKFEVEFPVNLLSSRQCKCPSPHSPPLKNMHISFHPINGVASSKLKLEFTGGVFYDDSIEELMFPSFQLFSGPSASQQHISSESDDDTFSLSSLDHPEIVFSPRSYSCSDSELWKFDREETKLESMNAGENILEAFLPSHIHDLPGLDSVEEGKCDLETVEPYIIPDVMLNPPDEQPPLPPLPPIEWRMARACLPPMEVNPPINAEFSMKSCSQQVLQAPSNQDEQSPSTVPEEVASLFKKFEKKAMYRSKSMINTHKFNGKKEVKAVSGKEPEKRVDLLYQTRNKSFNLRGAKSGRPIFVPEPFTNVKVAEILEKADAIRQAYRGYNEDGDDNWSDSSTPHGKGSSCSTARD